MSIVAQTHQYHFTCILTSVLFVTGCNITRQVSITDGSSDSDLISSDTFNQEVQGRPVSIKFDDEYEYKTKDVVLIGDSLEYADSLTALPKMASWKDVHFIRRKDRLGGALDLALFSIVPAILVAVDKGGFGGNTQPGAGIEGGLITVGIGALLGYGFGKDYIYEFNNPDD